MLNGITNERNYLKIIKMILNRFTLLIVVFVFAGCGSVNIKENDSFWDKDQNYLLPTVLSDGTSVTPSAIELEVFNLVNDYRVSKGLNRLRWSNVVYKEVKEHSKAMAEGRVAYSHDGYELRFSHLKDILKNNYGASFENVGAKLIYKSTMKEIAKAQLNGWINSEYHNKNMLEKNVLLSAIGGVEGLGNGWDKEIQTEVFFTEINVDVNM